MSSVGAGGAPLLAELHRDEARALADAGAIVVLPVGATEQHGPHLPLATDTLHAEHVAQRAAAAARCPVVVAPALPYGCSRHHLPFGGTASLSSATLLSVLADLGSTLAASGFRRIFLVNGHGGNHHLVAQSAQDLSLTHDIDVAAASWWHLAAPGVVAAGALQDGNFPGHAGSFETALVLALRPDLVAAEPPAREADPAGPGREPFGGPLTLALRDSWQGIDGWSDSPARGAAEKGQRYLELGVNALAAALERFADASGLTTTTHPE